MGGNVSIGIVDYGLGNLFSIKQACNIAGMIAQISDDRSVLAEVDALLLPGVGSFGQAMSELKKRDLVEFLQDFSTGPKPLIGICLGMQLMMTSSEEFGHHEGLGIIAGSVRKFRQAPDDTGTLKVPQIGWNTICRFDQKHGNEAVQWRGSPLGGLADRTFMYFVHSFYVHPDDANLISAYTAYGHHSYCSSIFDGRLFACQFHPERSGPNGLQIYKNIATWIRSYKSEASV